MQDDARLYEWTPTAVSPNIWMAGRISAAFLPGLSSLLLLCRPGTMHRDTMYLELSMVLCLALLISPISWTHYYLLLLLPLVVVRGNRLPMPDRGGWFVAVMAATVMLGASSEVYGGAVSERTGGDLSSHYVMGRCCGGVLAYARWRVVEVQHLRLVAAKSVAVQDHLPPACTRRDVPADAPDRKIAGWGQPATLIPSVCAPARTT